MNSDLMGSPPWLSKEQRNNAICDFCIPLPSIEVRRCVKDLVCIQILKSHCYLVFSSSPLLSSSPGSKTAMLPSTVLSCCYQEEKKPCQMRPYLYFTQRSEAAVHHEVDSMTDLGCVLEKKGCKKKTEQGGGRERGVSGLWRLRAMLYSHEKGHEDQKYINQNRIL